MAARRPSCRALFLTHTSFLLLLATALSIRPALGQQTTFTYQGYLEDGGSPATGPVDLRFELYDSESGGSRIGSGVTKEDVHLTDGVFVVDLDFGAVFAEGTRWLEIGVRDGSSTSEFTPLSPREALRPTPTAVTAYSLPNVIVDGSGNVGIGTTSPSSPLTVDGTIESTSGGITFPDGTTQNSAAASPGSVWQLGGNSGVDPSSGEFLGTTDASVLELRAEGRRALRIAPIDARNAPNIVAGHQSNVVGTGIRGATIGGGGYDDQASAVWPNAVQASYGTVSGGRNNTVTGALGTVAGGRGNTSEGDDAAVGGGRGNAATGTEATVGGGRSNTASGAQSTVGGGWNNTATGDGAMVGGGGYDGNTPAGNEATGGAATVGGGLNNTASGEHSTVDGGWDNVASGVRATVGGGLSNTASSQGATSSGGQGNTASGVQATVPGGFLNDARGRTGFAAGYNAKANHDGAFVWNDSGSLEVDSMWSTGPNQFIVDARGGVGFGTPDPFSQFHVQGSANGSAEFFGSHLALLDNIESTGGPDVLALSVGELSPGSGVNFVTFFDGNKDIVGEIEGNGSGGVSYKTSGADYAELLSTATSDETIQPGDIVGVNGSKITRTTTSVQRLMVVSDNPAVLGNARSGGEASDQHPVAFVGQVRARVRGPVAVGDLVVASGREDGTGHAVHPADWDPAEHGPVIGRAWGSKPEAGVGRVNVVVGLDRLGAVMQHLQKQQKRIRSMETRLERLEALLPSVSARRN